MQNLFRGTLLVVSLLSFGSGRLALADEPKPGPLVFTNATIYTAVADEPIKNGVMVVENGKILWVGEADAKGMPDKARLANAQMFDLKDKVLIPGLVDTHSHIGLYGKPGVQANSDGNEMSGPVQPGVRAIDSVWPDDPGIRMAVAGGVTTANIMPGSGNVIGGQTLYCKLRGNTVEKMQVTGKLEDGTVILGGLKMANGENPKGYGRNRQMAPFTRMKVAALQREQFVKAQEYKAKKEAGEKVERDILLEPLVEVLERKRTVHFHCHRADDLVTAIRLADEFGFELVLQHASEGYRIQELLVEKQVPVSITILDSAGGKAETIGRLEETPGILERAGVPVTINTDDFITESRFYLRTAAVAVHGGMTEAAALKAVTSTAAKVLHLDHRLGSLEAGKDADFVVLSGPPFSVYTKVLQTWIDGVKRFDAEDSLARPYRDGGFALPRGTEPPAVDVVKPMEKVSVPDAEPVPAIAVKKGSVMIRAGRIHTVTGEPIRDGVIMIDDGKITYVGPRADFEKPLAAEKIYHVAEATPGLIDPFSVVGIAGAWNIPADQDQDEASEPNQAELRVIDGYNPHEPLIEGVRSNGVTVLHSTPGRVNVIGGTTGVFRCQGNTAESASLVPTFALLINLGEVPKNTYRTKSGPQTRMGTAKLVREAFTKAQTYREKRQADKDKTPLNPKLEAMMPALEGKAPVIFAAHRADDIRTALRIADEFELKPVIALGTEAYLLADELAERKVPVIVHPTMQRAGSSLETFNTLLGNAALLKEAGVPVLIGTAFEAYVPKSRNLRAEAGMAATNGLGHAGALAAITLEPAKLLGIDETHGSLEVGKVADIVLYNGDPFEHATHVTHTLIGGRVVYDRAEYLALPYERRILSLTGSGIINGIDCCLGW